MRRCVCDCLAAYCAPHQCAALHAPIFSELDDVLIVVLLIAMSSTESTCVRVMCSALSDARHQRVFATRE